MCDSVFVPCLYFTLVPVWSVFAWHRISHTPPLRCLVTRIIHTLHRLWAAHCRSARGHGNAWDKIQVQHKIKTDSCWTMMKTGIPAIPSTELVATTQWTSYFDSLKPPTVIQVQLSYHHHPPRNQRRWRYSSHKLAPSCCCKMRAVPRTPEERRRLEPQALTMDTLDLPFWHVSVFLVI